MYRIGEQDNLIHYIHENAIEIIAENDLKSPSTETNQDCDLLQKLSGKVLTLCFNSFLQLCNFTSASLLLLIPVEHMLQHVSAQLFARSGTFMTPFALFLLFANTLAMAISSFF